MHNTIFSTELILSGLRRPCRCKANIDRTLTIRRVQHTGRPGLWLSVETEIYGWAESAWRRNESDTLKKIKCFQKTDINSNTRRFIFFSITTDELANENELAKANHCLKSM